MLTEEQLAITHHRRGHALVQAVPGSGKSTAAQHLIARHVQEGWTEPGAILAVCFNVDAAKSFGAGLKKLLADQDGPMPLVINLHALAYRWLRFLFQHGYTTPRKLMDDTQEDFWRGLVQLAISRATGVPMVDVGTTEIDRYHFWIVQSKARMFRVERPDLDWCTTQGIEDPALFCQVLRLFEEERAEAGAMSFDDLVGDLLELSLHSDAIYDLLSDRYDLMIVDEFQDMTRANLDLIRVFAGSRASVVAIGDDDQSIYGFRGADVNLMVRDFGRYFPKFQTYTLRGTFRYGHLLCRLSSDLIANNTQRLVKESRAASEHDTEVHLIFCPDESITVGEMVGMIREDHPDWRIGILVRAYHQTVLSEISLLSAGIPYRIDGAEPFFDRPPALAVAGYLALATGQLSGLQGGAISPRRAGVLAQAVLMSPNRFVRRPDLESAAAWVESGRPFLHWIEQRSREAVQRYGGYEQRLAAQLFRLHRDIHYVQTLPQESAAQFIRSFYAYLGLRQDGERHGQANGLERQAVYGALASYAERRDYSVSELQTHLAKLSDRYAMARRGRVLPSVYLTSWHKTKGGEFDAVLIPDLRAGKSPFICGDLPSDIEEERRLFFVAMTRARHALYLFAPEDPKLYATVKGLPDSGQAQAGERASPFLSDIADWDGVHVWGAPSFVDQFEAVTP
ncbi:ATP-dependent helicase [Acidithiobacillus caldus]|uniref:ATP-dependent helicase n=1 Tax=Acidithiobacillus caldus TaxID=33059 RepID=UPI001C06A529|nr:ATP-dependent helicase [Acidithiobacillus caldus]MBU2781777.1 ATP-dependent helicase [Acidithiobacillus caldus]